MDGAIPAPEGGQYSAVEFEQYAENGNSTGGHDDAEEFVDSLLAFVLLSLFVGVTVKTSLKHVPSSFRPPYTLILFLIFFGLAAWVENTDIGGIDKAVRLAEDVHPSVILLALLPPLLFESAQSVDFHVFTRISVQSLILAIPGVMFSTLLTALFVKYAFTAMDFSWDAALLLGSILSATDPVAVVAALHELGAPAQLSTLIEGESLLNDGTAFVGFLVFKERAGGIKRDAGDTIEFFSQLSFGGPALGMLGWLMIYMYLLIISKDKLVESTVVLCGAWTTYFLAETAFDVSAVLAIVVVGLYIAARGQFAMNPSSLKHYRSVILDFGYFANTVLFCISGAVIYKKIVEDQPSLAADGTNWGYLFSLYLVLHVVRALMIAVFWPFLKNRGYGLNWKEGVMLTWSGLRGAIAIALGLLTELDQEIPSDERRSISFLIAGIVFLTLLVNGSTVEKVYHWLKVYPADKARIQLLRRAIRMIDSHKESVVKKLRKQPFYRAVDWEAVDEIVPCLAEIEFDGDRMDMHKLKAPHIYRAFSEHFRMRQRQKVIVAKDSTEEEGHVTFLKKFLDRNLKKINDRAVSREAERRRSLSVSSSAPNSTELQSMAAPKRVRIPHLSLPSSGADTDRVSESGEESDTDTHGTTLEPAAVHFSDGSALGSPYVRGAPGEKSMYQIKVDQEMPNLGDEYSRDELRAHRRVIFSAIRAHYSKQRKKRQVGTEGIVRLRESVDIADADSGDGFGSPFSVEWNAVKRKIAISKRTESMIDTPVVKYWARYRLYNKLYVSLNVLHAYLRAHREIAERIAEEDWPAAYVKELTSHCFSAFAELQYIEKSHPVFFRTLETIRAAKNVIVDKIDYVQKLLDLGELEHGEADEITSVLEDRVHALEGFHPTVSNLMDNANKAVGGQKRVQRKIVAVQHTRAERRRKVQSESALVLPKDRLISGLIGHLRKKIPRGSTDEATPGEVHVRIDVEDADDILGDNVDVKDDQTDVSSEDDEV